MRRLTRDQLDYLYDLIGRDAAPAAVERGRGKSLTWSPAGRWRYVLSEDQQGEAHTLAMLGNADTAQTGTLF